MRFSCASAKQCFALARYNEIILSRGANRFEVASLCSIGAAVSLLFRRYLLHQTHL